MEKELTGVGEYTLNLLTEVLKQDNKNEYYLFFNSRKSVLSNLPKFKQKNVHYCGFNWPNKLLNLSLKLFKYPKLDQWIMDKYHPPKIDLFFFPNISFLATKCPYIITSHDLSFEFFPEFLSLKRRLWHEIINPKKLFVNAKQIIAVSDNTEDDLFQKYSLDVNRIKKIYSGITPNYKIINHEDSKFKKIKQKYSLPEKFILFLGTIEPRKNILGLIEAFNLLDKEEQNIPPLILVGKLGWKYKKIIKAAEENKKIRFIKYIKAQEKRYFYNAATLFVYPSFYEGFGFPPLEAQRCGCAVVTANNSSLIEICSNNTIFVDPNNLTDLKNGIKAVLKTTSQTAKPSATIDVWDWTETARQTIALFEKTKNS